MPIRIAFGVAFFCFALLRLAGPAAAVDLTRWFFDATQAHNEITLAKTSTPDFLPGKTTRSACGDSGGTK